MCMIIFKPAHKQLPEPDIMNRILVNNPHGTGTLSEGVVKKFTKECYPWDFSYLSYRHAFMLHARIATRGSICLKNVHPFYDESMPGLWFAHNGTTSYRYDGDMTDSEWFYHNVLVPFLKTHPLSALVGYHHDMRSSGSRFILWTGRDEDLPYLYGVWFIRKGLLYSHYVEGSKEVGVLNEWWQPTAEFFNSKSDRHLSRKELKLRA